MLKQSVLKSYKLPMWKLSCKAGITPSNITINCSKDLHEVVKQAFDYSVFHFQECFVVIALNRASKVVGLHEMAAVTEDSQVEEIMGGYEASRGGITGTVADPRIILKFALLANATSIVLAHNHPSGNLKPSEADQALTQKIKYAASFLDIKILDHLILAGDGYYSFADEGIL